MWRVMMFRHIHRNTTWNFDFDFGKARSLRVTMNANELLDTRRVGRRNAVFLAFGWTEGEPTHFVPCLAVTICQRRSRSELAAV
jgi:hypothetical protein